MSENPSVYDAIFDEVAERGYDPYNHFGRYVPMPPLMSFSMPKAQAQIDLGNLVVQVSRPYSWLQRTAMRLILGWKVENL